MSNKANRGVGPVPEGLSEGLADFLGQVRRIMIDIQAGRVATLQLPGSTGGTSGGGGSSGGGTGGGTGGTYEPDLTPPPTPTVFNAVAGMDFVGLTTEAPTFTQGHGYLATIVYGAKYAGSGPEPTFANAVQVHDFIGEVGTFPTDPATVWHLWAKWKTRDGVLSNAPAGGANGVRVTTGQDVTRLMTALAGKVKNEQLDPTSNFIFRANLFTIAPAAGGLPNVLPFSVLTAPTMTPAGELLPAGTYIDAAYIRNLEAALGRFQNAFITNAMIVSVSASRITSGVISVGNYIQSSNYVPGVSGWRIHGDGSAELAAASIRGKLTANQIDGKGLEIRDTNGNLILGAGNALALGYVPPGALNSNISLSASGALSGGGGGQVTLPGMGLRTFRVGAYGLSASGMPIGSVLRDADTNVDLVGGAAMYRVVKIHRATGAVTDVGGFNTLSGGASIPGDMAAALNAIGNDHIVVVFTFDEPQGNRLNSGLAAAMYRCGASRAVFGSPNFRYRAAYVLIGIPGCGEGNGFEAYAGDVDSAANAWCDVAFTVRNGNVIVGGGATPRTIGDYGYSGDLNATHGATIGQNLNGAFSQSSWDVVMPNALIKASHIQSLSVGVLSTTMNGGSSEGIRMETNKLMVFSGGQEVVRVGYLY